MSGFTNNPLNPSDEKIDFNRAEKLPGGGSTCDIYKAVWERRQVFVKRLKEKYRNMPLYLSAFDKEYEIGISLKHHSLPDYRGFGGEYIIMDFIEGTTLAKMLKSRDPWLSKEKNVLRLLKELLDVVDYLHQRNVVHCDIKPDNIMITHGNRNLMLIDLDKCYTDWHNDTAGASSKFGLPPESTGEMDMDFHCIALILEKIKNTFPQLKNTRYKDIITVLKSKNLTADDVRDLIEDNKTVSKEDKNSNLPIYGGLLGFVILIVMAIVFYEPRTENDRSDEILPVEETKEPSDNPENEVTGLEDNIFPQDDSVVTLPSTIPEKELTMEEKGLMLDEKYKPIVKELTYQLEQLQIYQSDTTLTFGEMLDYIRDFADLEDNLVSKMWGLVQETFPETPETDVADQIHLSKVYSDYMHRADSIQKIYSVEMDKRREARK